MKIYDEANVIQQILNGNTSAFKSLVDTYKDLVFNIVIKILRNREEAEEVTQDSFLKAYHALGNFKNESKFSTWLFRIAYNTAISRMRKKTLTTASIDDQIIENFSIDTVQEQLDTFTEDEKIKTLNHAIEKLAYDEQLLINLFYYNQQSIDEICNITGLTDSNVKVKLHRIRKKMYYIMEQFFNKEQLTTGR